MALLELWYELGEDDTVRERMTEEELRDRLESLVARGFVETTKRPGARGKSDQPVYRVKGSDGA
jgi:hypothetical protein